LPIPIGALRIDMFMELVSTIISFTIGYYSLKGYRVSSEKGLLLLHFGFITLGVSMLLRVITTGYILVFFRAFSVLPTTIRLAIELASIIYSIMQLIAYALFASTYVRQAKMVSEGKAIGAIFLLLYNPYLELIAVVLLGYVTIQSIINLAMKKGIETMLVSLGFSFMFLSHLFFLFAIVDETLYMIGQLIQMAGFICLLIMLMRVSKIK